MVRAPPRRRAALAGRRHLGQHDAARTRSVIRADVRETGNGRENGSLALKQAAFARTNRVEGSVVDRVGGIKDLAPVGGAVSLAGDKYHRRRAHAATLEVHIAPAADVDQAGEISAFRSIHRSTDEHTCPPQLQRLRARPLPAEAGRPQCADARRPSRRIRASTVEKSASCRSQRSSHRA
jgi:hypothetical protein